MNNNVAITFSQLKLKMGGNVLFALEEMNKALLSACADPLTSNKEKFRMTQDYLALYVRLENEIQKQEDHRESMRYRKMVSKIKQHELNELDEDSLTDSIRPINQSKFKPTMN